MAAKREFRLLHVAVFVAVLSSSTLIGCKQSMQDNDPSSKSASEADTKANAAESQRSTTEPVLRDSSVDVLSQYKCDVQPCQTPFSAANKEEANWLRTHGYPTEKQREDSRSLSSAQLKARANQGDLAYQALYGEKLAEEGRSREGLGVLGDAATHGSLYALYSISDVYARESDLRSPTLSRAYLRLAYLAGDSKATYVLAQRFPEFNSPLEAVAIDRRASELHRSLLKNKSTPRPL